MKARDLTDFVDSMRAHQHNLRVVRDNPQTHLGNEPPRKLVASALVLAAAWGRVRQDVDDMTSGAAWDAYSARSALLRDDLREGDMVHAVALVESAALAVAAELVKCWHEGA